jgi:hypothetical protein
MRAWILTLVLLGTGAAQAASTPEQTVKDYMTAFQQRGMTSVAEFIHPAELERFKSMLMPVFENSPEADRQQGLDMFFGKGTTLETLKAMPPAKFMSSFMEVVGKQLEGMKFSSFDVLGSVREGELVHVVTRVGVDAKGIQMTKLQVTSTKPFGKEWKLILTGELEGIANAMKAARQ